MFASSGRDDDRLLCLFPRLRFLDARTMPLHLYRAGAPDGGSLRTYAYQTAAGSVLPVGGGECLKPQVQRQFQRGVFIAFHLQLIESYKMRAFHLRTYNRLGVIMNGKVDPVVIDMLVINYGHGIRMAGARRKGSNPQKGENHQNRHKTSE